MPVRLKITFLFSLLVSINLLVVCAGIYYFTYQARVDSIKKRLTNRAITTARLLEQRELDQENVRRIDSLTTLTLEKKSVQAFNDQFRKLYSYSDFPGDTVRVTRDILQRAQQEGTVFFRSGEKEAVASYYSGGSSDMVVVSAGEDVDGKNNLRQLLNILFLSFLIGTSIVVISGYFFSTRLLLPIKKITGDVEEISAQNLTRRIHPGDTRDEWYELTETLNRLLNRLQESFELQRRFISNASHELSTPLTSISSQLEVAMQKERSSEEYKKIMQSVYQDVRHMGTLTQTLLEFAKASGNPGGLEINLVRIDEILMRIPFEITRYNKEYKAAVLFDQLPENEEQLLVFGNEYLLLSAVKNIVVNGCKYSKNLQAEVRLSVKDQIIQISVTDEGKGIPEDKLKLIFQPFYRVEDEDSQEGFGLGLSLAYRIIRLHKGDIIATSLLNKGTTFVITLPTADASILTQDKRRKL